MTRVVIRLFLAALCVGCSAHKESNAVASAPPSLTVTPGESIFAVIDRVPGVIDPGVMHDDSSAIIDRPHQLTVTVDRQPLALPPTRYTAIGQVAGVVTGVETSPMLSYADLAAARELSIQLVRHAEASGWTVAERFPLDLAQMQAQVAGPGHARYDKTVAQLRRGAVELRVSIREASGVGLDERQPPARGNLFLVNADFAAPRLADEQNRRLFARRREVTGGVGSLPLAAWRPAP